MKKAVLLMVVAGPAAAHEGAHLHPHDGGAWLGMVAVLAGLAMIAALGRR